MQSRSEVVTKLRYGYLRRHDLRHTGPTSYAGVPVHVLRKIAGHGSLMTTQRYLHTPPDADETAVEAFSRIRNRSPRSIKRGHGRPA